MAKTYKVWVEIEEIDEDEDSYENIGEPMSIGEFDSYEEALEFQRFVVESSN